MKILLSLLTLGAVAALGLGAAAAEEAEIIYSATSKKNAFVAAASATGVLEAKDYSAAVRAQNDSNVYRSEGRASARHDEISSYAISFYITFENPGTVYLGHSLAR
jgi:ABC-type sugar transport system substrate-binding protein